MHRSNFRPRNRFAPVATKAAPKEAAPLPSRELEAIKEQIANVSRDLSPLRANVERLAAPKEDISVPGDIAQSLRLVHGRLDRLERQQREQDDQLKKMATTFSNALLRMGDKVEKISGGEDSSFSLAHSLEKLLAVLTSRRLRIIRDKDGNMAAVEPVFETKQ